MPGCYYFDTVFFDTDGLRCASEVGRVKGEVGTNCPIDEPPKCGHLEQETALFDLGRTWVGDSPPGNLARGSSLF